MTILPSSTGSNEYQPRTPERLVELLRSFGYGQRSWQSEAADMIERMRAVAQAGRNAIIEDCAQIADKYWAREVASQIRALTQPPAEGKTP